MQYYIWKNGQMHNGLVVVNYMLGARGRCRPRPLQCARCSVHTLSALALRIYVLCY
jgi:hypothetical protein